MAFGVLDPVTDKAAIDYDRNMINDFLSAIEAGSLEEGLSVFTERVSDQKWGDLSDRARVELMAVIPQIVEEAPLVSCDDLTGDDFSGIEVPTFLIGTENGPPPAAPIIQRIAAAIPGAEATQLAGAGHMAPITHTADVGDAISGFWSARPLRTGGSSDTRSFKASLSNPATILYCSAIAANSSGRMTACRSSNPSGARSSASCITWSGPLPRLASTILFVGGRRSAS